MKKAWVILFVLLLICGLISAGAEEENPGPATPTDLDETTEAEEALIIPEEMDEAEREEHYCTLTFVLNNGTEETFSMQVYEGEPTAAPDPAPTREGYVFEGWYNDPVVGKAFEFGGLLYGDQTLYAHWSRDDWKIGQWFKPLIRGGSNIHYVEESRTLAFDAGELIFTRHDGSVFNGKALAEGYYLGFRIEAPRAVSQGEEIYRIEIDGTWKDLNGPAGIGSIDGNGRLYVDLYEKLDLDEIRSLADQNALKYTPPPTPGDRDALIIEEEGASGRRGRGDSTSSEETAFTPTLKSWSYRIAKAGAEGDDSGTTQFRVTLDPRHIQLRDGNDLAFAIQGYRYRFRVRFNPDEGSGSFPDQILFFGQQASEPEMPTRDGYVFDGWYTFWQDGDEIYYNDWAYDFGDRFGVRSSFTLRARWKEISIKPSLNLVSSINMFLYLHLPEEEDPSDYRIRTSYHSYIQSFDRTSAVADLSTKEIEGATWYQMDALHAGSDEMTDRITVTLIKGDTVITEKQYSIRSVAEERLTEDRSENEKKLYRALLQYGRYAQIHFGNHADDLPGTEGAPALVPIPGRYAISGDPTDFEPYITKVNTGLALDSTVDMNVYLTPAEGYGISDFEISVTDRSGNPYRFVTAPEMKGGNIHVRVYRVYADQMSDDYHITVRLKNDPEKTAVWTRSLMTCAYKIQDRGPGAVLLHLVQALYQYHLADREYWGP